MGSIVSYKANIQCFPYSKFYSYIVILLLSSSLSLPVFVSAETSALESRKSYIQQGDG